MTVRSRSGRRTTSRTMSYVACRLAGLALLGALAACGNGGGDGGGDQEGGQGSEQAEPKSGTLWVTTGTYDTILGIDLETMEVEHTIDGLEVPFAVTYGHDRVWALDKDRLLRIDPASGETTRIAIEGASGLTVTDDGLWVANGDGVAEMNPEDNRLSKPLSLPFDRIANELIYHDKVVFGCDETYGGVIQIDTQYDQVFANDWTQLGRRTCTQVRVANDTLYVAAEDEIQSHELGDIDLIERWVAPSPITTFVPMPDGKALAVASQDGDVRRLDLETGEYGDPVTLATSQFVFPKLTTDGEQIWASGDPGKVLRLNPETLAVEDELELPDGAPAGSLTLAP